MGTKGRRLRQERDLKNAKFLERDENEELRWMEEQERAFVQEQYEDQRRNEEEL